MLQNKELLKNSKNLLAFSAGVDSTALLFLLLENNIPFDIALVNYGLRQQAKKEISYAQHLAKEHNFTCHLLDAPLIDSNFEANARVVRYDFFEKLIQKYHYDNLVTAHHLGDRFEWMLMQFCKGAGCLELSGMQAVDKRQNYTLIRPLLQADKEALLAYLHKNNIHYFVDASNLDEKYKRNEFRHRYAKPLLEKYLEGIQKSFHYLDKDVESFIEQKEMTQINQLAYCKKGNNTRSDIVTIDKYLKTQHHLITAQEKALLETQISVVLGRKFIVSQTQAYIFVAPYVQNIVMEKKFKEKMRLLQIDPKLRGYLATDSEAVEFLSLLLE